MLAQSDGAGPGGAVSVALGGGALTVDSGASLGTIANGSGNAGDVSIRAGQVTVDMTTGFQSSILLGIGSLTGFFAHNTGNAGNVAIAADALTVRNNASVSSLTFGPGSSGRVDVNVFGLLSVSGPTSEASQVITAAGILAGSFGSGNAGEIAVTAGTLSLVASGLISSDAFAAGNAGSVSVGVAGGLTIAGGAISSNAPVSGNGGNVSVSVGGALTIDDGVPPPGAFTGISSEANASSGKAGLVSVNAGSISLANFGQISSDTFESSGGGQVAVSAGALSIASNGEIASGTFASGKGGNVSVDVTGLLTIDGTGGDPSLLTGISTASEGSGDAGTVTVTAGTLSIAHNGLISSSSANITSPGAANSGNGGKVSVLVGGQLTIDGAGADPNLPTGLCLTPMLGVAGTPALSASRRALSQLSTAAQFPARSSPSTRSVPM